MRTTLLLLALSFATPSTIASDWPQWRGPSRTGHVPANQSVPDKLPASPKVLWKIPLTDGLGSPVVASGKLFILDNRDAKETAHCIDAATGSILWSTPFDDVHKDSQSNAGPRSTPVIDGDRLYVQSCRGEFQCLNAADGKIIWRKNFVKDLSSTFVGEKGQATGSIRHGYNSSPLIDGDHILVTVGAKGASMVCFDKKTGDIVWKSHDDAPAYAAPVLATIHGIPQIVYFTAEGVVGLKRTDGSLLWRFPIKTAFGRHVTTPLVLDDIIVVSSHQSGLFGIKVSPDGAAQKAEQLWLNKEAAINFACPVLVGQHLYGLGPNLNLICIDAKTGKEAWSQTGYFRTSKDKAHCGMVVLGNHILTLTDGGELVLFPADPKEFREISRVQACAFNWCNPAYANGNLYLRDRTDLRCIQVMP